MDYNLCFSYILMIVFYPNFQLIFAKSLNNYPLIDNIQQLTDYSHYPSHVSRHSLSPHLFVYSKYSSPSNSPTIESRKDEELDKKCKKCSKLKYVPLPVYIKTLSKKPSLPISLPMTIPLGFSGYDLSNYSYKPQQYNIEDFGNTEESIKVKSNHKMSDIYTFSIPKSIIMTNVKTQKPLEEMEENEDINNGKDNDKFSYEKDKNLMKKAKQIAQMFELMDKIRDNE